MSFSAATSALILQQVTFLLDCSYAVDIDVHRIVVDLSICHRTGSIRGADECTLLTPEEGYELGVCFRPVLSLESILGLPVQACGQQNDPRVVWPLVCSSFEKLAFEFGDVRCNRPLPLAYSGQALTSFLNLVWVFEGALHVSDQCIGGTGIGFLCSLDVWEHRTLRARSEA